jgi:large subunit ribosomal protein L25
MEQKVLNIEIRSKTGKGISRRLRKEGLIPAVVYGKGIDAVPISVNPRELSAAIAGEGGRNNLITLQADGPLAGSVVIVADVYRDCLKGNLLHADFHKINLQEKVKVHVEISLVGTAIGVKEGGLLDFVMHNVEVECLPTQIPEHLEINVADLKIGDSLHVNDLEVPPGIKVLADQKATIVNILGKSKEDAAEAAAEAAGE